LTIPLILVLCTLLAESAVHQAAMATRVAAMLAVAGLQAPRVPLQPKSARQVATWSKCGARIP
jgi:hypothetical protein